MKKQERQHQLLSRITTGGVEQVFSTRELAEEFNVSEITMRRDLQELADAGFIQRQHGSVALPKVPAQTLKQVGIILVYNYGKFSNPFFNELLEGADSELQHLGYHPAFVKTFVEVITKEQINQLFQSHPVQGLLFIGGLSAEKLQYWQSLHPNVVTTLTKLDIEIDTILFDGVGGMRQMVRHLAESGHKRIGFISGQDQTNTVDSRLQGYLEGIAENNLDQSPELLIDFPATIERIPAKMGREGTEKLMSLSNPPTAIMCLSDLIALGAMQWLQVQGYRIPEDVAVTGFDNIPDASVTYPALTTVHVHKRFLGKLAANQLHRRIENPHEPPIVIYTPTSLVIRQSTGAK